MLTCLVSIITNLVGAGVYYGKKNRGDLFIHFLILIGCSTKSNQIVVDAVSDAQTQIQLARRAGAKETTSRDLLEAQQLLDRAGELMSSG